MQAQADKAGTTGPTARQDPSLPQVFGRYLLLQRLSRGGMGEIFLAKHGLTGFEKLAVIKKVLPHLAADAQFISRFVDEAQVAIKLQHVNVAQVFEVGRVGDEYFLALEYVEGRDLRRTLARLGHEKKRLPVDLALFIGRELANGLAYAHRRTSSDGQSLNLVHCDISPPNVLVSFEGETKVIDFGIAKSALRGTATDPKMGFGKFGYMAPEQLIRGGIVDHRTDIYAAGVVLYELLTGQRLYEPGPEPDYRALAKKVARGEYPLPSSIDPALQPYDQLVSTTLRPKSDDRFQSAAELRDAIQQALVAVNPTISTDQLGAYMRDLFADEMSAQRELHDRIAKTHLEDFQADFHTQTISTVSFALAQLPLQAPPDPAPAPVRTRASGQQRAIPSTIVPPQSLAELDLADGTGTAVRELPAEVERKKPTVIIFVSLAVIAVAAVAIVMALNRGGDAPAKKKVADVKPNAITFEPIDDKKAELATPDAAVVAVASVDDKADEKTDKVDEVRTRPAKKDTRKDKDKDKDKPKDDGPAPKAEMTLEILGDKMRATSKQYQAYKQKNGMQLDAEWNELMQFLQNKSKTNLDEAARRLDSFRAKLRE
ncbi:MAG: serine/threonine protein kinase [Kofleriaceae bacterium]